MKSRKRWDGTFADWEPIARRIAAGQNRARAVRTGHRWPKKARELYAGRHVWRFLAKNPAPAVPWGRNLGIGVILELNFAPTHRYGTPKQLMQFVDTCHKAGIGVILELSFPSSECRCKGVYEPGTADPEENPSKIAVRARFLANWRGRREACTSGDSIWKPCGVLGDATKETTGSCAGGRPNRERRGPLWFPSRASRRPYCSSEA